MRCFHLIFLPTSTFPVVPLTRRFAPEMFILNSKHGAERRRVAPCPPVDFALKNRSADFTPTSHPGTITRVNAHYTAYELLFLSRSLRPRFRKMRRRRFMSLQGPVAEVVWMCNRKNISCRAAEIQRRTSAFCLTLYINKYIYIVFSPSSYF